MGSDVDRHLRFILGQSNVIVPSRVPCYFPPTLMPQVREGCMLTKAPSKGAVP